VLRDGSTISAVIKIGPTRHGNLAEFTVAGNTNTVEITLSPNVTKHNVERALSNAFAQTVEILSGNNTNEDLLTSERHPGDKFDLSHRDHGRQGELRNLDRSTKETSRLRMQRRRRLAAEMAALVEHLGVHPDDETGGLDRAALVSEDIATILAEHAPPGSRRPSWTATDPTGLPPWRAYPHQLVLQGLPGLFAASAIISTATSTAGVLAGTTVGIVSAGTAVTGTLVKRWTAARNKRIGDASHEHAGKQREYEANQRRAKLLDSVLARSRSTDVDLHNGPEEPAPGAAPDKVPTYRQRLLDRALAPAVGAALGSSMLAFGLSPLMLAGQAGLALIAYAAGPIVDRYLRTAELTREVGTIDSVARDVADLAHQSEVAFTDLLHKVFDRLDALAGVAPTGVAPESGEAIARDADPATVLPYGANNAVGESGNFSRALEDIVNGKAGTIPLVVLRFMVGTLGMAVLDQNYNRAELAAVYEQVMFDEGTRHLERQATFNEALQGALDKIDQHLTAMEQQQAADQRVERSAPSRIADRQHTPPADRPPTGKPATDAELAESLPADRPVGMQRGRAFAAYATIQGAIMSGAMTVGTALFGSGVGLERWTGPVVIGTVAVGGIIAAWSKFHFRAAEQQAGNDEIAFNQAKDRAADAAKAERTGQYTEEFLNRELAEATDKDNAPTPPAQQKVPMVIGPRDPRYADYAKKLAAEERARLAREPRPYSLFDARRQGLDRIDKLADKLKKAALHAERTGNDRPLKRAADKLAAARLHYQRLVNDGTPMPTDDEAPKRPQTPPPPSSTRSGPDDTATDTDTSNEKPEPGSIDPDTGRPVLDERLQGHLDESAVTPGGRAFYPAGDPLHELAQHVPALPGLYSVDLHGAPDAVFIGDDVLTVEDLAALIESDPNWHGQDIWLFSCWTGAEPGGFAQQLADWLGVEVIAPAQVVGNTVTGETFVTSKEVDENGNPRRLVWPPTGFWNSYRPIVLNDDPETVFYQPSFHLELINQREAQYRQNQAVLSARQTAASDADFAARRDAAPDVEHDQLPDPLMAHPATPEDLVAQRPAELRHLAPPKPLQPTVVAQSLGFFKGVLTRDGAGLITHVGGVPVRAKLHELAKQRAEFYHREKNGLDEHGNPRPGGRNPLLTGRAINQNMALVMDLRTGEVFEATNVRKGYHSLTRMARSIQQRIADMFHHNGYRSGFDPDQRINYPMDELPYRHGEIRAVNAALAARPGATFSELVADTWGIYSELKPVPFCPNCSHVLHDVRSYLFKRVYNPDTHEIENGPSGWEADNAPPVDSTRSGHTPPPPANDDQREPRRPEPYKYRGFNDEEIKEIHLDEARHVDLPPPPFEPPVVVHPTPHHPNGQHHPDSQHDRPDIDEPAPDAEPGPTADASSSAGSSNQSNDSGGQDEPPDPGCENVPPAGRTPIYTGDERLWPDELADLIAESESWTGGPIRLLIQDGVVDEEFLRRLADLLGVAILVPAESVVDGFPRCSSGTLMVFNEPEPVTPPDGEWRTITPRSAVTTSTTNMAAR